VSARYHIDGADIVVQSQRNRQLTEVGCVNVYGRKRGRVGVKQHMHSFHCYHSLGDSSWGQRVFDQGSHSVTRGGGGVGRVYHKRYHVTEMRTGENLSLSITKQDRACNYVSLR
jgi:hypothetical protein